MPRKPDPRRRMPASKLRLLLRRLEVLYQLSQRSEINRDTARLIASTAETAYREIRDFNSWLKIKTAKRSDEIRSAARAAGLRMLYQGQEISSEILAYRLKAMAKFRSGDLDAVEPPGYWFT